MESDVDTFSPHAWTLRFEGREDAEHCEMVVHLNAGAKTYTGQGKSRRNPVDPQVPRVGEELAAARALQDLSNQLTNDAWHIIDMYGKANA